MPTPGKGVWITTREAAIITGRKATTIRKWVARGHLHPRTIGGRQRVEAAQVLDVERDTRHRKRGPGRTRRPA